MLNSVKRNILRNALLALVFCMIFLKSVTPIFAFSPPSFPSCETPQGKVLAAYSNGDHGIVGSSDTHTGSDTVYSVSPTQVLQCFCPPAGTGIQTQWLKADTISTQDQDFLIRSGWILVPNGALWGLDAAPYLTLNSNYVCNGSGGGGGTGGSNNGAGSNNGNSNSNSNGGSNGIGGGGSVLGISTIPQFDGSVLGLASTGTYNEASLLFVSLLSFFIGTLLILKQRRQS